MKNNGENNYASENYSENFSGATDFSSLEVEGKKEHSEFRRELTQSGLNFMGCGSFEF